MSNPRITPVVRHRPVRYHADASSLFAHLGGVEATDSLLLESADITTKSGLNSVAVLSSSLRITCNGDEVRIEELSASGAHFARQVYERLGDYAVDTHTYRFPVSEAADERARLADISSAEVLRALTRDADYHDEHNVLPMLGGGFAFDYLATFETLPEVDEGANTYPDYQFLLAETVLTINHQRGEAMVHAVRLEAGVDTLDAELDELAARIDAAEPHAAHAYQASPHPADTLRVTTDISDAEFRDAVTGLKESVYNGDIYQVVPARTFMADCPDAFAAYRRLRAANPSPYMFYARGLDRFGQPYELFGASPESNLKYDSASREVQLYPIAGTRPRGLDDNGEIDDELDIRMELELRTDAKEIAEHTMLVDLARNDLARVGVLGTRKVAELLQVDRYSRVMHLVSRVVAQLDPTLDALDAYRACMNMGTLSGAPKLKAMELLRGVEKRRRGSYGGAIGYLRGNGDMDNCIVIRSAYVRDGVAAVQAGAGVVRDSNPQSEADETLHKAYAVLSAIAAAANAELEVVR
ncbi:anthranilate synthase component 1 [Corynebacterium yudongzhengii]|uniref:Anthranilate synthase component 1 n=1 Tax=Corynebacterium yudongzhengii TaxID=2080740 RepID=A0A2U1T4E0_9CORY|nr:anthranilate synthase component 1 [Corynebacterium yudongzhengii]AWB82860.1 anthranilate synthase component 1 [Corynebacterium yudongzhengii]PWC00853.1 anthranilate synthase component 1 [Corynebacterium yudongzhengii]